MTTPDSFEDRILRWAATDTSDLPDFPDDKSDLPSDFEYNPEDYEDDEVEIIEEMSESELLNYLGQQETSLELELSELNIVEHQQSDNKQEEILNDSTENGVVDPKSKARLLSKSDKNKE